MGNFTAAMMNNWSYGSLNLPNLLFNIKIVTEEKNFSFYDTASSSSETLYHQLHVISKVLIWCTTPLIHLITVKKKWLKLYAQTNTYPSIPTHSINHHPFCFPFPCHLHQYTLYIDSYHILLFLVLSIIKS